MLDKSIIFVVKLSCAHVSVAYRLQSRGAANGAFGTVFDIGAMKGCGSRRTS